MSNGLIEPIEDLITGVLDWALSGLISGRKEKAQLQHLMSQQRQEHIHIVQQWAVNGKGSKLCGFDLSGAELTALDLSEANLEESNLQRVQMWNVDLSAANLKAVSFRGAKLVDVNLKQADLERADFSQAELENVDFGQANLRGTNLSEVKIIKACTWAGAHINAQTKMRSELRMEVERISKST